MTDNKTVILKESATKCALEFFKLRFPEKIRADNTVNDPIYFMEWVGRFKRGSAYTYADNESWAVLNTLETQGLISLI